MNKGFLITLLSAMLLLSACSKEADDKDKALNKESASLQGAIAVTATEVKTQAVPIVLEAVGEVQSIKAPKIGAEVAGRVTQLLVDVGDVVAKGDVLGELDRSGILLELDVARAERSRVKALTTNQELVLRRQQDLKKKSFVSESAIDDAKAQLRALREQLKVAKAQVALAEYKLSKTIITAPLAGKIDSRIVSVGDYVKDGAALFTIADTETLRIQMVFPEPAMAQLHKGTPLKVITAVNPGNKFDATITEIRPQVESANKGVVAYADLADPSLTRAGASAAVWATLAVHEDAVVIPQTSLVQRPAGEVVYVIGANNKVSEHVVISGARLENSIEIVKGIEPGVQVVVDGAGFLTDGVAVEIKQ